MNENQISGICMVLGPTGFVANPAKNNQQQQVEGEENLEVYISPTKAKRAILDPVEGSGLPKKYLIESYEVACDIAREKAKLHPGKYFQVLKTCTIFESEVKEPAALNFKSP